MQDRSKQNRSRQGRSPHDESKADLAIVLATFGTLHAPAEKAYDKIIDHYRRSFPEARIELAFTSGFIRSRLKAQGSFVHSPLTALAELQDEGYRGIVVQPIQVIPGEEFHQIVSLIQGLRYLQGRFGFRCLEVGAPLLFEIEDYYRVSRALSSLLESSKNAAAAQKNAVVLAGHGTNHPADSAYSLMAAVLGKEHQGVFLGTLEGRPGLDDVMENVRCTDAREIMLVPFLLVAGVHAQKDLFGEGPGSWRHAFEKEGFIVKVNPEGLIDIGEIIAILSDHTARAVEKIKS